MEWKEFMGECQKVLPGMRYIKLYANSRKKGVELTVGASTRTPLVAWGDDPMAALENMVRSIEQIKEGK